MKFDSLVDFIAKTKQYVVYGVGITYPIFTLITFLGVIKMAWNIPPEIAACVAFGAVYIIGSSSFKIGLYAKDMNITWKNTPMAVEIYERTERMEKAINEIKKSLEKPESEIERNN
jgi:uncharacterized membrane protein (GlpM family)